MEPINLVVGRTRWRLRESDSGSIVTAERLRRSRRWEEVSWGASWAVLMQSLKAAGFRAVYPEAVEPLCKAIQERMEATSVPVDRPESPGG